MTPTLSVKADSFDARPSTDRADARGATASARAAEPPALTLEAVIADHEARVLPQIASADPALAIPNFIGRPLLMLNASFDSTVTPDMGKRLFNAAAEPKEQRWYDSGHRLPAEAYEDAAEWVKRTWAKVIAAS